MYAYSLNHTTPNSLRAVSTILRILLDCYFSAFQIVKEQEHLVLPSFNGLSQRSSTLNQLKTARWLNVELDVHYLVNK